MFVIFNPALVVDSNIILHKLEITAVSIHNILMHYFHHQCHGIAEAKQTSVFWVNFMFMPYEFHTIVLVFVLNQSTIDILYYT